MLTQTEIICLAIRAIDADIAEWKAKCDAIPGSEGIFVTATADLYSKRNTLKKLFFIQTGTDYE